MNNRNDPDWIKFQVLIHRRVCPILQKIFKERWKKSERSEWSDSPDFGKLYITGIGAQLYRNAGQLQKITLQQGDLNNWDFPLLAKILTESNFKNEQNPQEKRRLQELLEVCENAENCQPKTMKNNSFVDYWDRIEKLLVTFGDSEHEIEALRLSPTLTESDLTSSDSGRGSGVQESAIPEAEDLKDRAKDALKQQEFDKALTLISKAIALPGLPNRELGTMYSTRCEIYSQKGKNLLVSDEKKRKENFYLALKDAKSALHLRPVWGLAYYKIGMAYLQLGKLSKANKYLDQALDLEPNMKEIQQAQRQCRGKLRKPSVFTDIDNNDDEVFLDSSPSDPDFIIPGRTCYTPENEQRMDYLYTSEDPIFHLVMKGHNYRDGRRVAQDFKKAAACYKKAAKQKNPEAMYNLALLQLEGRGVTQNIESAIANLKSAASIPINRRNGSNNGSLSTTNVGVADSQLVLGILHAEGIGCLQKNAFQAAVWYRESCENGNGPGAHNLGLLHWTGQGVKEDKKRAVQLWKLGAERKVPESMVALAMVELKEWNTGNAIGWLEKGLKTGPAFNTGSLRGATTLSILRDEEIAKFRAVVSQIRRWRGTYDLSEISRWEQESQQKTGKNGNLKERLIQLLRSSPMEKEKIAEVERYLKNLTPKPVKIPFPLAKAVSVSKYEAYKKRGFSFSGSISRASNLSFRTDFGSFRSGSHSPSP